MNTEQTSKNIFMHNNNIVKQLKELVAYLRSQRHLIGTLCDISLRLSAVN